MKIRPLYDRIVVKRIEEQETTRSGIVIPDSAKEKPQEGEVMAIGKGKRLDDGKMVALDVADGERLRPCEHPACLEAQPVGRVVMEPVAAPLSFQCEREGGVARD